jgi:cysteinyl-tRNA synthetase
MFSSCATDEPDNLYRDHMRSFVVSIADYADARHPGFIVIPQNGIELVSIDGEADGEAPVDYLAAIDGVGQEDLFYGYRSDDKATPASETEYLLDFLEHCENSGVEVLVTDYCNTVAYVDDSYASGNERGFITFAAPDRELAVIPSYPEEVYNTNDLDITDLSQARNFLYLINPENFNSNDDFIEALSATAYDLFIIDLFTSDTELSEQQINDLKTKPQGGSRLVIAYMSIGEAEDYRYYWKSEWESSPPDWLLKENPDWEGNYKVAYWKEEWQSIMLGSEDAYLDRILSAGFDGVYLDIIEAFEYFE